MHIGLVIEHSDPRRGGAESFAHALVARLRLHGHVATLASGTGPMARRVPPMPAACRPIYYARRFLPELRREGVEVTVAFLPVPGCDFFQPRNGIVAASIPPHLEMVPQPWRALRRANPFRAAHFALLRRLETGALRPPSRCIAISPRVVGDLERWHPQAPPPLLLRTGVDLERFHPALPGERRRLRGDLDLPAGACLLFVGHNCRLKGLACAIEALPALPGATLVVAGREPPGPFRQMALRHKVLDRVQWRGEPHDLPALYRACDLLLHPTWYDTASRVVLEALASGTPAITTRRDGNADHAEAGGGAALPRPGDARSLAEAVVRLLEDRPAERAALARRRAELYPWEGMLDAMVEAITCVS